MDPLSISATCIGLASTIARTSLVVIGFVKDVRAARADLDAVSRELLSLKTVLELLADDVNDSTTQSIPQTLQKQIAGIVTNCTGVVVDIEQTLKKHEGGKLNKAAKWVACGKNDVTKLRSSLEAHKSALETALDMVTLTLAREIKADTQEILNDTSAIKEDTAQISAIREDTSHILAEIARLQEKLPRDGNQRNAGFMLERYLDNLTSYAETVCDTFSDGSDGSRPTSRPGSSGGEAVPQTMIKVTESGAILPPDPRAAFPAPIQHEHIQKSADAERSAGFNGYAHSEGSTLIDPPPDTEAPADLDDPWKTTLWSTTAADDPASISTADRVYKRKKRRNIFGNLKAKFN